MGSSTTVQYEGSVARVHKGVKRGRVRGGEEGERDHAAQEGTTRPAIWADGSKI